MRRQHGPAIRAIRKAKNIKLRDLARLVGVHESYLSHVEANRRSVSQETLDSIAHEMAIPVEAIMRDPA